MKKFYVFCKVVLTLVFSIVITLDSMLVFPGGLDYTNIRTIYFTNLGIKNILIFFGVLIGTYLLITLLEYISNKIENTIYEKKERKEKNIKVYFIILAVILICWMPTILSYFPGGIYADTVTSISEAISNHITNHNPMLYTLMLKTLLMIGLKISSFRAGLKLFSIFQVLVMASIIAYVIYWLYKRKISLKYIVLTTIFFGLVRLIPMYAISIWKDTPFSLALLLYSIFIAEIVYRNGKNIEKPTGIIIYSILILAVCFLRNNGVYVSIATTIMLMIIYRKKVFNIVSALVVVLSLIIQGPVFSHLKVNAETVENLGVPLQQLCYVAAKEDGNLTDEQKEFINNICDIETIKQEYNPCLVDKIKWNPKFNSEFLDQNKTEFIKVWAQVFVQNPISYVKAYLLNTLGFWDVNKATMDAYINPKMWNNKDEIQIGDIQISQKDYIQKVTNHSVKEIVTPTKPISSAVFLFIMLFSALITLYKKQYKNLLIYLPGLLTWATIMIAAPLAFSLRYVYILVLMTPITILIPFLKQEDAKIEEKEVK